MASQELLNAQKLLEIYRKRDGVKTAVSFPAAIVQTHQPDQAPAAIPPDSPQIPPYVKAYPDLQIGFHNSKLDPVGRVYLLLRAMDASGRNCGWLPIDQVNQLADKMTPWHMTGARNLRGIIGQGDGTAWTYDKGNGRLWLHGAATIASKLEIDRLNGLPVQLPVDNLLSGIQAYRAAILAAWHAGRKENSPISRIAIHSATGIPQSSQRTYDKVAATKSQTNYALTEASGKEAAEETAWRGGRGVFAYTDWVGKIGERGKKYLAETKPNSYLPNLAAAKRGRQRKINRQIARVNNEARGNGLDIDRTYYQNAAAASKAYNRDASKDKYYPLAAATLTPTAKTKPKLKSVNLWAILPGIGA